MAFRILALSFLSVVGAFASDVTYFPINSVESGQEYHGLVLYFGEPAALTAEVTVEAIHKGKPVTVRATLDTDRVHGDRLMIPMQIDERRRYELIRMTVEIGGNSYTIEKPRAGEVYKLLARQKRRTS